MGRWPEAFRVLGLKGAELAMLGFITPINMPWADDTLTQWHSQLYRQTTAPAYRCAALGYARWIQ